jgi:hypothetical protein
MRHLARPNPLLTPPMLVLGLLVALSGLAGCGALNDEVGLFGPEEGERRGQTVLFVGTDPTTLRTDLYMAQALVEENLEATSQDDDDEPGISEASGFEVSAITNLEVGGNNALQSETDTLFSVEVPYPVPDLTGSHIAILGTTRDADGEPIGGRIQLLDTADGTSRLGDEVAGLFSAAFTWGGRYLVLERRIPEDPARTEVLVVEPDLVTYEAPVRVGPEGLDLSVEFAGHVRDGDHLLVLARDLASGQSDVWRVDPDSGASVPLTELPELSDRMDEPTLSSDGRWLAVTRSRSEPGGRAVLVIDTAAEPFEVHVLSDDEVDDCRWPVWAPLADGEHQPQLAFACVGRTTERPDILRWTAGVGEEPEVLTAGYQDIFDGTMDGLVFRSAPFWDPRGEFLVFGASRPEDVEEGVGMTLTVLPVGGSAYPVWAGDEGSGGWAHFSSATEERNLLLWDRAESGLEDSEGRHPIRIVFTEQSDQATRPVELGRDLLVAYPQLLGWNTMIYP